MTISRLPRDVEIRPYVDYAYQDAYLVPGDSSLPRLNLSALTALVSGCVHLTYFTGKRSQPINNVKTVASTAAGATPTLCKEGIYSEAANGDLTKLVETTSDTALWGSAAAFTKAFSSTWNEVEGQRYAYAAIIVTAAALPSLLGVFQTNSALVGAVMSTTPKMYAALTGQTDLPSTISNASLTLNQGPRMVYAEFS